MVMRRAYIYQVSVNLPPLGFDSGKIVSSTSDILLVALSVNKPLSVPNAAIPYGFAESGL